MSYIYSHLNLTPMLMPINNFTDQTPAYQVLDPALLGRPIHLLSVFAGALATDLATMLDTPSWRRYWSRFRLFEVEFARAPQGAALRWLGLSSPHGAAAVAFERALLVGLLEARYARKGPARPLRDPVGEPVTATEERLAHTLTQQMTEVLMQRLQLALGEPAQALALSPVTLAPPAPNAWTLIVTLREPQSGALARCFIAPDNQMMGLILQALQPVRPQRIQRAPEPLASSLKLKLEGRLVSHEMTLETLFRLKVGDVVPVTVGRADVMLDEARLFTAAVAELKGKLCLTSFVDAE